jgi:2-methylaconitate cis-trans-isomerase PrpF
MSQMRRVRCAIMRGGTSKGIFLLENDLPQDKKLRDEIILKIFGSPDVRQIDGLGGADPLTSKLAIIGPSSHPDADVDYTFGQVSVDAPAIGYNGNCGNISAAVGPFAIEQGLVRAGEKITVVRIHNTNTNRIIIADIPMAEGEVAVDGDCKVDGVPGTGAKIMLDYSGTVGSVTGKLLPTGKPTDIVDIPEFGKLRVSIVDAGNPIVFVRAKDLNLSGTETPANIDGDPGLLNLLETIRAVAGVKIGMAENVEELKKKSPGLPMLAFVGPAHEYTDFTSGSLVSADDVDFVSRLMFMQIMHKTYAGTAAVCTACAAKIPGSVVYEMIKKPEEKNQIRIGHPSGVIEVEVGAKYDNVQTEITRAAISRTARRIMDGYVYVR